MDKGKKRERNVNFSREETEKIVSLVERYKHIVENKKSDAITWQEKEKAWNAIEAEFNSSGAGTFRDAKHLKQKYESLKRDTRKKSSVIRAERYKTGGGVNDAPLLTPVEQKVKEMILLSVEGDESIYDSDQLQVPESEVLGFVVCTEGTVDSVNLEVPMTVTDTADYTVPENQPTKRHVTEPSNSKQVDPDIDETPQKKWAEWKPASLKSKKHPALSKPKEKRPFDKLAEGKLQIVMLQKKLIEEELEEKCFKKQIMKDEKELKKQMMKDEMEHKKELYKLEREEMLLKIEILKSELVNKKKF